MWLKKRRIGLNSSSDLTWVFLDSVQKPLGKVGSSAHCSIFYVYLRAVNFWISLLKWQSEWITKRGLQCLNLFTFCLASEVICFLEVEQWKRPINLTGFLQHAKAQNSQNAQHLVCCANAAAFLIWLNKPWWCNQAHYCTTCIRSTPWLSGLCVGSVDHTNTLNLRGGGTAFTKNCHVYELKCTQSGVSCKHLIFIQWGIFPVLKRDWLIDWTYRAARLMYYNPGWLLEKERKHKNYNQSAQHFHILTYPHLSVLGFYRTLRYSNSQILPGENGNKVCTLQKGTSDAIILITYF